MYEANVGHQLVGLFAEHIRVATNPTPRVLGAMFVQGAHGERQTLRHEGTQASRRPIVVLLVRLPAVLLCVRSRILHAAVTPLVPADVLGVDMAQAPGVCDPLPQVDLPGRRRVQPERVVMHRSTLMQLHPREPRLDAPLVFNGVPEVAHPPGHLVDLVGRAGESDHDGPLDPQAT